jgi:hypothetical protein
MAHRRQCVTQHASGSRHSREGPLPVRGTGRNRSMALVSGELPSRRHHLRPEHSDDRHGVSAATSALGLGSPLPHLHLD